MALIPRDLSPYNLVLLNFEQSMMPSERSCMIALVVHATNACWCSLHIIYCMIIRPLQKKKQQHKYIHDMTWLATSRFICDIVMRKIILFCQCACRQAYQRQIFLSDSECKARRIVATSPHRRNGSRQTIVMIVDRSRLLADEII